MSAPSSPAVKRRKISPEPKLEPAESAVNAILQEDVAVEGGKTVSQVDAERAVGITEYLNPELKGWNGILKMRYTDFLVNEIDEEGKVVHLTTLDGGRHGPVQEKKESVEKVTIADRPDRGDAMDMIATTTTTTPAPAETKIGTKVETEIEAKVEAESSVVSDFELSSENTALLTSLTSPETIQFLLTLHRRLLSNPSLRSSLPSDPTACPADLQHTTPLISPKEKRTQIHQLIRTLFTSSFSTTTLSTTTNTETDEGRILITPMPTTGESRKRKRRGGKGRNTDAWEEKGGEYVHFHLYKENRDTMEVLNIIPRLLKIPRKEGNRVFSFAGTKDRRAVTVQRCAAYRISAERLAALNKGGDNGLRDGCKLGDFRYEKRGLELGDLAGNEFAITLRDCSSKSSSIEETVKTAVEAVKKSGFINYFGLQRFGSFSTGTWEVGVKLLNADWRGAVEKILAYDPTILESSAENIAREELARAEACHIFFTTYDFPSAAEKIPRKFVAESTILRVLSERGMKGDGKGGGLDYLGAIQAIPRSLRTMYVHAYQSYVWNHVVSARIRQGLSVKAGDLVVVNPSEPESVEDLVDQDGEIVVSAPKLHNGKKKNDDFTRARPLSAAEAESGKWNLEDIVLPTPGWDVVYPESELMKVYTDTMAPHGLDPKNMKRSVKEISLPGSYRKVLGKFLEGEIGFEVRGYRGLEQVVQTDLKRLKGNEEMEEGDMVEVKMEGGEEEKVAIVLRLRLGTSMYATMALRELMKEGLRAFKPEFGRG
ncbi:multisubstrate pseudouridine synthase 7 [Rhizina undulata]